MTLSAINPPADYLRLASRASLQAFELARLNEAANLRREAAALLDQWVDRVSEALLARWMIDHYDALHDSKPSAEELAAALKTASAPPLPEVPPHVDVLPAPPHLARYAPDAPVKARK